MEFLIIQTAFIGDVALAVFFANELKQNFPYCKIHFISTEIGCEVLRCFKFIDNPIIFSKRNKHKGLKGINELANYLNNTKYNYIFSLHRSFRTAILVNKIKAEQKIGFNKNSLSFLLNKRIKYNKFIHEIERNKQFLSAFATINKNFDYLKCVEKNIYDFNFATNVVDTSFQKPVLIAPCSVWETKQWDKDYFVELTNMLKQNGEDVYLIGGKEDIETCNYIAKKSKSHNLSGQTSIPQVLELVCKSKLVITNDSAPTHFASLFNIPTITIYGATSPKFGFTPLAEGSVFIEDKDLFCHPCSVHGDKKCPRKTLECMKNITPKIVYEKYLSLS
ncbi:MAG: glycosyltransferase family 9 protein [Bacteroidetes bacterium]|nr:glycosyltransferase family 9 protein [Bacteroidota bacterium]